MPVRRLRRTKARRLDLAREARANRSREKRTLPIFLPSPDASPRDPPATHPHRWPRAALLVLVLLVLSFFLASAVAHARPSSLFALARLRLGQPPPVALAAPTVAPGLTDGPDSHAGGARHATPHPSNSKEAPSEAKHQGRAGLAEPPAPAHAYPANGAAAPTPAAPHTPHAAVAGLTNLSPSHWSKAAPKEPLSSKLLLLNGRPLPSRGWPAPHQIVVGGDESALKELDRALSKAEAEVEQLRLRKQMLLRKAQLLVRIRAGESPAVTADEGVHAGASEGGGQAHSSPQLLPGVAAASPAEGSRGVGSGAKGSTGQWVRGVLL